MATDRKPSGVDITEFRPRSHNEMVGFFLGKGNPMLGSERSQLLDILRGAPPRIIEPAIACLDQAYETGARMERSRNPNVPPPVIPARKKLCPAALNRKLLLVEAL